MSQRRVDMINEYLKILIYELIYKKSSPMHQDTDEYSFPINLISQEFYSTIVTDKTPTRAID